MIECVTWSDEVRVYLEVWDNYKRRSYRKMSFLSVGLTAVEKYSQSLINHITYVREAGEKLGVPEEQLIAHDASKWSHEEFPQYAMNFHGGNSPVDADKVNDGFVNAWLHHAHHNPHHWQHWIFPDGYTPKGSSVENGVVKMPNNYALEMVADWMGASMAYTGSWDMQEWLWKNLPKIRVHSETAKYLRSILDWLGYADVAHAQKWGRMQ